MTEDPAVAGDIERVRVQMKALLPADREYPAETIEATAAGGGWRDTVQDLLQSAGSIAFEAGIFVANATADADLFMELWITEAGQGVGGYKWSRHGARSDGHWNSPLFSCAIPADLRPRHFPRDLELGSEEEMVASLHWAWATAELTEFEHAVLAVLPTGRADILRRSSKTIPGHPWIDRFPTIAPGYDFFYRQDHLLASLVDTRTSIEMDIFHALGSEQGLLVCRQARAGLARLHPGVNAELHARLRELAETSAQIRRLVADSRAAGAVPIGKSIPIRQRGLL